MSTPNPPGNDFINKVSKVVEEHMANEQFGVSELAQEVGMSRSNLLRKIKKLTNLSVSQYIRQLRLQAAFEMLKDDAYTISEISYKVGFSSTSYFIKCFGDHYGYPPGEIGKNIVSQKDVSDSMGKTQSHQLAAIMFTDIEGYTALMQQNEDKAVSFRNRHREVFNRITAEFKGKILQYFGDGTLSTFASAIDAVRCGIELQKAFRQDQEIPVRIGIHSGDIIFTKDDIIGDGVNVASRIESMAVVGSVFISEKVFDEVKNQSDIQCLSLGNYELKNVDKTTEVFAITNPGLVVPNKSQIAEIKRKSASVAKGGANNKTRNRMKLVLAVVVAIAIGYLISSIDIFNIPETSQSKFEAKKSIAVLPFKNDSNDSTNVYLINGLMESILTNLQKIEDLRVISRTSVEKYRNHSMTIPEIAKELNVSYFVEGSGQKIGDQILLNIQLIEGETDNHLWAEQYNREVTDIFGLQQDIAKNIASGIEVVIAPEVVQQIEKVPTQNLEAYDDFLKGLDLFNQEKYVEALEYYQKAIAQDDEFARAHAGAAIAYFLLDIFQVEKQYVEEITHHADKAMLLDPELPQSLIAKALVYMIDGQNASALPYLEKALEISPNSALVINILSNFYANQEPNTAKYLEYALKGISLDIAAQDSSTASFTYMHLSNAFVQTGFAKEALVYIDKSLAYNPNNLYSEYLKAYVMYANNFDLEETKQLLIKALEKDSSRLDIMQEVGKIFYYQRDFENAYVYYKKFLDIRETLGMDLFRHEHCKMGVVMAEVGLHAEAEKLLNDYKLFADQNNSLYRHLNLAMHYAYVGETEKAIENLKLFSEEKGYQYWIILFVKIDPLIDKIKDLPEFKKTFEKIESKFWENHLEIKTTLEEKGLI